MYFPDLQNVQRNEDAIIVYLTPNESTPPCPPELRPYISEGDWSYRLSMLNRLVKRSTNVMFERGWFGLALLATFIAPIIIYHLTATHIAHTQQSTSTKIVELYAIGFGIFLAICLLFWLPLAIWKGLAILRLRKILRAFEREDCARQRSEAYRPRWRVQLPGVFSAQARITVHLPPPLPLTSFSPDGELPPYIAAAPPALSGEDASGYGAPPAFEAVDGNGKYMPYGAGEEYGDVKRPVDEDEEAEGMGTATPRGFARVDLGGKV